jgi:hypothetical protein
MDQLIQVLSKRGWCADDADWIKVLGQFKHIYRFRINASAATLWCDQYPDRFLQQWDLGTLTAKIYDPWPVKPRYELKTYATRDALLTAFEQQLDTLES